MFSLLSFLGDFFSVIFLRIIRFELEACMVQPENITHKGGTMLLETPYFGLIHIANTVGQHPI